MERDSQSTAGLVLVVTCLLILFGVGVSVILTREIAVQEQRVETELAKRSAALREYLLIAKHLLYGLRNSMQAHLQLAEADELRFPLLEYLQEIPEQQGYAIVADQLKAINHSDAPLALIGSLTGRGAIADITSDHRAEINAALGLNGLIESIINSLPDVKWVYYASKKDFAYLAPAADIREYHFSIADMKTAIWQVTIPQNNPSLGMVVTDVYNDAAGKGMVVSFSLPVVYKQQFRGVVAIDLGVDSLMQRLNVDDVLGYSALLNERHQVVVKQAALTNTQPTAAEGEKVFVEEILEKHLTLLHKVPRQQVVRAALKASFARLLLVPSVSLLLFLAYFQRGLLQKIKRLADIDPLTKLMNRRSMARVVDSVVGYSLRYQQSISFLLVDIDHFKRINDTYGHATGDEVLVELAQEFSKIVRGADQISRHGGEEFLFVLPNSKLSESYELAERIRAAIVSRSYSSKKIALSVSIGCAEMHPNETYSDVLNRADEALYRAKERGRNRTEKAV